MSEQETNKIESTQHRQHNIIKTIEETQQKQHNKQSKAIEHKQQTMISLQLILFYFDRRRLAVKRGLAHHLKYIY